MKTYLLIKASEEELEAKVLVISFFSPTELRTYPWKLAGRVKFSGRTEETESAPLSRYAQEHKVLLKSSVNTNLVRKEKLLR